MNGKRVVRLDGLRFFAALCVVFFHFAFRGAAAGVMPALDLPSWLVWHIAIWLSRRQPVFHDFGLCHRLFG